MSDQSIGIITILTAVTLNAIFNPTARNEEGLADRQKYTDPDPMEPKTSVCYGLHVPVCGQGMKPACICEGDSAQVCHYICMPK